jgi:hypothetical protein
MQIFQFSVRVKIPYQYSQEIGVESLGGSDSPLPTAMRQSCLLYPENPTRLTGLRVRSSNSERYNVSEKQKNQVDSGRQRER